MDVNRLMISNGRSVKHDAHHKESGIFSCTNTFHQWDGFPFSYWYGSEYCQML